MTGRIADGMIGHLSARAAAERCGVSERTLRRWIASGRLPAKKDGGSFRVAAVDLEMLTEHRNSHAAAQSGQAAAPVNGAAANGAASAADMPQRDAAIQTLIAEVRRLNDERAELYGRLGYMQAQLAAKDEQIKALQAPKEPITPPPPAGVIFKPLPTEPDPPRRPWWRFWS
jgi:excisionase family DNA binding protein